MLWVWCLSFYTGNMNLVLLLTHLLLSNSSFDATLPATGDVDDNSGEDTSFQLNNGVTEELSFNSKWETYKSYYGKEYDEREDHRRMEIFIENDKFIQEHNQFFEQGRYTYQLGHNQFSDLTHEEYLDLLSIEQPTYESAIDYDSNPTVKYDNIPTVKSEEDNRSAENPDETERTSSEYLYIPSDEMPVPFAVDWRGHGAVTPVKNEGRCGASWAFSATGAMEGQLFRKTHHLESLSEQNLVDCTSKYGNHGCGYGTASSAYKYIMKNGGINTNITYRWYGKKSYFCHYKKLARNPTVHGIVKIRSRNESNLVDAIANVGPISVAVDARSNKFKFYKHGIFYDPHCSPYDVNREVLVVGYSRSFFIIKNSWGRRWGSGGYMFMSKTGRNHCGIATRAIYPIV